MKTQSLEYGEYKILLKVSLLLLKAQYSIQFKVLYGRKGCRQNHYFSIVYEINSLKSRLASHYCRSSITACAGNQVSQFFIQKFFTPYKRPRPRLGEI